MYCSLSNLCVKIISYKEYSLNRQVISSTFASKINSGNMTEEIFEEWQSLTEEYKTLEENNIRYLKQLKGITDLQHVCSKGITHQRYRMKVIQNNMKNFSDENDPRIEELKQNIMKRDAELEVIEQVLPKKSGRYLRFVLGNLDISFLDKDEKFRYKEDYETFKLVVHVIAFVAVCLLFYFPYRPLELLYITFLIWYYGTISIRESILKANGSKIKGWWRLHHIISIIVSAIFLIWPDDEVWNEFRGQFLWYNIYTYFITYLQFKYQRGALYRLKSLGQRHNMDITVEGFHSWMWRGLAFLLPFLFIGYLFQLMNAFILYRLSYHPKATWQVLLTSITFMILFVGNTTTTMMVIPNKIKQKMMFNYRVLLRGVSFREKKQ